MRTMYWITMTGALCAVALTSCGKKTAETGMNIPYLTDSLKKVVTVATVEDLPYEDELVLNGQVQSDPNKVAHIFPMFGGTVIRMNATVGDHVRKGQVLAVVRSGEVADYAKQMNDAELLILTAKRDKEATHEMYQGGMASNRDVLQAERAVKNAEAERKRLEEIYTINHITGNSTYAIKAPISGFITEANISPDMQIRPDQDAELFTLSGLDNVWVVANVYENDINKVRAGAEARITTLAYGDSTLFRGVIDKVYPVLDEASKTEDVKINLPNPDYRLKPGMFANVYVPVPTAGMACPAVPAEAVIFDDDKHYVVTIDKQNVLAIRKVRLRKEGNRYDYIAAGLKPGERIVAHNALLVYNALK